ncbi:hypothetical protein [Escherichia coli]
MEWAVILEDDVIVNEKFKNFCNILIFLKRQVKT